MSALLAFSLLLICFQGSSSLIDAERALEQGNLVKAEQLAKEILQERPQDPPVLHLIGSLRMRQGRAQEAEALLLRSVEIDSTFLNGYRSLGELFSSQQRWNEAQAILERGLTNLPSNLALFYDLAKVEAQLGNLDASVQYLKAIPEDQAPPDYWETVGRVLVTGGDYAGAEEAYLKVLAKKPGSIQILRTLTGIALKQLKNEQGWQYISEARRLAPHSPGVLFEFGQVSLLHNLIAEASGAARLLLMMEPDKPEYVFFMGNCLLNDDHSVQAAEVFSQYLELKPDDANGYLMLGIARHAMGRYQEALETFRRVQEINPALTDTQYWLGMTQLSLGNDSESEKTLRQVVEQDANHWEAHLALGKLYIRQKKVAEARISLEKAAELKPTDSDIYFQLSRTFRISGDMEAAREAIERYRKLKAEEQRRRIEANEMPFTLGKAKTQPPS
jgi:tetratricopeptide (TPR) repeat protein